jgi:hypothetical protein
VYRTSFSSPRHDFSRGPEVLNRHSLDSGLKRAGMTALNH